MVKPAAYLRVYEPLAAFEGAERRHWERYAASGGAPDAVSAVELEHRAALHGMVAAPPRLTGPGTERQASVLVLDGVTLVCPWRTRLRAWLALEEFRSGLPDLVADAFLPRAVADAAAADLAAYRADHPESLCHVRTSMWHVPPAWFVLVDPAERELVLHPRRSLRYVTPMVQARRRVSRALPVLRRTLEDGPAVDAVEDLDRWLEQFHSRSAVELDYGGIAALAPEDDLRDDSSASDVAEALAALAEGDGEAAGEAYGRVASRARALALRESDN